MQLDTAELHARVVKLVNDIEMMKKKRFEMLVYRLDCVERKVYIVGKLRSRLEVGESESDDSGGDNVKVANSGCRDGWNFVRYCQTLGSEFGCCNIFAHWVGATRFLQFSATVADTSELGSSSV